MTELSPDQLQSNLAVLEEAVARKKFRAIDFYEPYPKQKDFFALGATKRERMFLAGNQLGKTHAGAFETTVHLTGEYPDWWPGRKWEKPVKFWAAGETSLLVRDVQQKKLCGEPGVTDSLGTGFIPKDRFHDAPSLARGVTDAYDTIQIIHSTPQVKKGTYIKTPVNDGVSICRFKSYEQGRTKFQGETLEGVWGDEETPMDIYSECLTRTNATGGMVFITFTPLKGRTDVVQRFLDEQNDARAFVVMTIVDAKHISPEDRATIIASYPAHEREARVNGVPMQGSGRIFVTPEDVLAWEVPDYIPVQWAKIWGIDFGIDHPFAAALLLWDKDNDVIYVYNAFRMKEIMPGDGRNLPMMHAAPMKTAGVNVPVAWPQDGHQRDKGSGEALSKLYKAQGLDMLPHHATWADGSNGTEAGILEMQNRMNTGKLRVARHLSDWFEEYRFYHRKDGLIVKVKDDILSATRVGLMAKRFAKVVTLGGSKKRRSMNTVAKDVDFDLS